MQPALRPIWLAPIGLNTVLGVAAFVPYFLIWYVLVNFPLHDLGLTSKNPTENDGSTGWFVILAVVLAVYLAIWFLSNYLVRNGTPARSLPARRYWTVSAAVTCVVPFLAVALFSVT